MKTKFLILLTISCPLSATAEPRASADYTLTPEAIGGAGGRAASTDYTIDHATGAPGGAAASTDLTLRGGYAGQLFEVAALAVTADPATLDEGDTRQLAAQVVLDDDSLLPLAPEEVAWSVAASPRTGGSSSARASTTGSIASSPTPRWDPGAGIPSPAA